MKPRVAILQLPGGNGEGEAARAVEHVGLHAVLVPWTAKQEVLAAHDAYIIPGGFSYQDRVRAGAVAARLSLMETVAQRAEEGAPVLGICNGAQVLVEGGLVPGGEKLALALAPNRTPGRSGYYARWTHCRIEKNSSLFLQTYSPGEVIPLPIAHAEGRFESSNEDDWSRWEANGQLPLRFSPDPTAPRTDLENEMGEEPWNPNGSRLHVAGIANQRGNVLALMPHPERAESLFQVPLDDAGPWGARRRNCHDADLLRRTAGPGRGLFISLAWALGVEIPSPDEPAVVAGGLRV